jgi:hypothetical protein
MNKLAFVIDFEKDKRVTMCNGTSKHTTVIYGSKIPQCEI